MHYRLDPPADCGPLPYQDIIIRLEGEFGRFVTVEDRSEDDIDGMVAELIELGAPKQQIDDAKAGVFIWVFIYDDDLSDDYVAFELTANTGSIVGHYPSDCGDNYRRILNRCAHSLGYSLHIE